MASILLYALPAACLLYMFSLAIYRLYFHRLARFPGPKLAALTLWYEFYYDVVQRGQFTFEILRMHEQYGPIVRINPHELHILDSEFYDQIYVGSSVRRTEKHYWSARMFGNPGSVLSTVGHETHRMRRQPLNPFFSKASVIKLEPMFKAKIDKLCARLAAARDTGEPVRMDAAYHCLITDMITEYSVGRSFDFLDRDDFVPEWIRAQEGSLEVSMLQKQLGWLIPLMNALPPWFVKMANPDAECMLLLKRTGESAIKQVMTERRELGGTPKEEKGQKGVTTIFHELLDSNIPQAEKSFVRLSEEAMTIIMAGITTTGHYLKDTTYHLLANPSILSRLLEELQTIMPDPGTFPTIMELESLPYLTAVVNEGFRLTYGISGRLTRISPDQPIQYREWIIPAGIPVGMTGMHQHRDPRIFPDPDRFDPERFLNGGEKLTKYLVNFSKGTRACLGINLARAEIYLVLASIMRRFGADMELYETDRSDIDLKHEFFSPVQKLDSKGLRVVIKASGKS